MMVKENGGGMTCCVMDQENSQTWNLDCEESLQGWQKMGCRGGADIMMQGRKRKLSSAC